MEIAIRRPGSGEVIGKFDVDSLSYAIIAEAEALVDESEMAKLKTELETDGFEVVSWTEEDINRWWKYDSEKPVTIQVIIDDLFDDGKSQVEVASKATGKSYWLSLSI